jgi:hypothetical protein
LKIPAKSLKCVLFPLLAADAAAAVVAPTPDPQLQGVAYLALGVMLLAGGIGTFALVLRRSWAEPVWLAGLLAAAALVVIAMTIDGSSSSRANAELVGVLAIELSSEWLAIAELTGTLALYAGMLVLASRLRRNPPTAATPSPLGRGRAAMYAFFLPLAAQLVPAAVLGLAWIVNFAVSTQPLIDHCLAAGGNCCEMSTLCEFSRWWTAYWWLAGGSVGALAGFAMLVWLVWKAAPAGHRLRLIGFMLLWVLLPQAGQPYSRVASDGAQELPAALAYLGIVALVAWLALRPVSPRTPAISTG